nr:7TM domain-containing protein [Orrella marina]
MINPYVEHLFFVFPELLLIVLALALLVGRYTGYRLVELLRFRTFAKD